MRLPVAGDRVDLKFTPSVGLQLQSIVTCLCLDRRAIQCPMTPHVKVVVMPLQWTWHN